MSRTYFWALTSSCIRPESSGTWRAKRQIMILPAAVIKWDSKKIITYNVSTNPYIHICQILRFTQTFCQTSLLSIWNNLCKCSPCTYIRGLWGLSTMELFSPSEKRWQLNYENMRIQSSFPRRAQTISIFCFFAFHVQCWPVPPPLAFCVETCDGSKCFSGECLGERAQGKVHIEKQNQNVKKNSSSTEYDSHQPSW